MDRPATSPCSQRFGVLNTNMDLTRAVAAVGRPHLPLETCVCLHQHAQFLDFGAADAVDDGRGDLGAGAQPGRRGDEVRGIPTDDVTKHASRLRPVLARLAQAAQVQVGPLDGATQHEGPPEC